MSEIAQRLARLSPERRAVLQKILREQAGERAPGEIRPREADGPAPLSFAQQRLWVIHGMDPASPAYHMPLVLRLRGRLEVEALRGALSALVERHESLRTVFPAVDGSPVQRILPAGSIALAVLDASALAEAEREAVALGRVEELAWAPMALERGPLFRPTLLRVVEEDHLLVLAMHHIVSDGWSNGVLFRELGALYTALLGGEPAALRAPALQYADYAVWQRERLQGEVLERQVRYWRERLAGAPALLEIPTDRPRRAFRTARTGSHPVRIPPELGEGVRALAREEGATLFMAALAAFQLLLSKYAGAEEVVVGTPVAGRTHQALEELVGFFVNALAIRTGFSGDPSFREVLARVKEGTLGAFAHQELPFERLVEELQPERSAAHAPVFQVVFTLQNLPARELRLPGVVFEAVEPADPPAKFDLSLGLTEGAGGMSGWLRYDAGLFDASTMERLAGHFLALLRAVVSNPDARISTLSLLEEAERRELLVEWSAGAGAPVGPLVHESFAAQARRAPGGAALCFGEETLGYDELRRWANRIAHHLRGEGVGPEVLVGVCLEPGPEQMAAVLGVLAAGGAYLPLDPAHPPERTAYVLRDAGAGIVLTREGPAGSLAGHGARSVLLDRHAEEIAACSDRDPEVRVHPESTAYVIYTSGSTGRPKGVAVEHGSLAATIHAARETFGFGTGEVFPALASYAFDIWGFELFLPLVTGGTALLLPREEVRDVERLCARLEGVDGVHAVPALMREIVHRVRSGPGTLPRIRRAFVGGDAVAPDLLEEMREAFPAADLHVLYGPTEGTIICASDAVPRTGRLSRRRIGRPLPGAALYVLDAGGEPLPVGVPGELCIGGGGVARGYLGCAELTAERFVPDPFGASPGRRLYRSGDRVRWMEDGTLEFLGRVDRQVKVRGFRIEPEEIEAALREHPGVREAAVVVREGGPGEPRLVGYVAGGEGVGVEGLRTHLAGKLPEHMVPSAFVLMEALPLTPTGKVDRRALPEPAYGGGEEHVAPRTPAEEILAGIWAEVLRVERVGVRESFFALGGHSLLATRVVSRVREAFRVELPLRALFEHPTVEGLAGRVEALLRDGAGMALPPIERTRREGPLPLSFAQQRLWFLEQMEPGSAQYSLPSPLRLRGRVDPAALRRALEEVVRRHEVLRTTFHAVDGTPVQVVAPPAPAPLPGVDLSALSGEAREAEVLRLAAEEVRRPFDLARGPLLRATLLRASAEEHVLLLNMHHVVSDGWSMGVLTRELSALYAAFSRGEESPLAELPVQYADYAVWQRAWLTGDVLERQLAWWRERLAGAPPLLELPTDRPRSAVREARGAVQRSRLPGEASRALRALAEREGATLFMVLLAGWQALLSRYSGQEDVVVGSPIAGRTHLETEGLIGFFVNTLALRTDLSGGPSFRELLARVREGTLGAYAHQDVPFERLVEELQTERSLTHTPLVQAMLSLQNVEAGGLRLGEAEAERMHVRGTAVRFDLVLTLVEDEGEIAVGAAYRADLWDGATIERMLGHFGRLLAGAAADPARRVGELELLGSAERAQLLEKWNATGREHPEAPVHELFTVQAARTPGAVAVESGEERLTYAELEDAANRLAQHLGRKGVGPEARVGIFLERGAELVVGVLAILKAGGAYVALDPSYPDERLLFVLRDAGASALVTRSALAVRVAAFGGAVVRLDADREAIGRERAEPPAVELSPESLCYVIYTSGSTGTPKGALVTHGGLGNYLHFFDREIMGEEGFALPLVSRLSFDAHVRQLFPPLLRGEAVWVLPEESVGDPGRLLEALGSRDRVSFGGVPSLWGAVLDALDAGERPAPRDLRAVLLGGEALPAELVRRTLERFPGVRIWNHYGPTEATVNTTVARVESPERVTLGRPVANVRVYLLDAHGAPSPVGVPGEAYVAGAGVSRGYLGRPEMTAERFLPDPFSSEPGGRMYRTGDRVRWLGSGELEFLGRVDQQVKVRGFRIEPGEVEAVLRRHLYVRDAVVAVREDGPGGLRLVGYVVPREGPVLLSADLRAHAGSHLPEHMVPGAFVFMEALPLTPNGKVDRKALPAPEAPEEEGEGAAPRTPAEEVLAGIWERVLQRERVGTQENFFALGGHSLAATVVTSHVRKAFGVELPLRALFEAPTVAALAERIEALLRGGEGVERPPLVPAPRDAALPLSFAQQRLWFLDQMDPGSALYNLSFPLRLHGTLEVDALRRALGEVVRRHEVLRTGFPAENGQPVQVVGPPVPLVLPQVSLRALAEADREHEAGRLAAADAARGFDLARGPLLRAALLHLEEEEWVLLLTVHHIAYDGWSNGVLNRELAALYDAFSRGEPSPLPEPAFQYADYALWQRDWLSGEVLEGQIGWWREELDGAPPLLELPTDRPRTATRSDRGGTVPFGLPETTLAALHTLARGEGATLFMALLAAWQTLLSRYSGQEDVVVGAPIAGRTQVECAKLVGFFVNTLALRGDLSGGPSFRALLSRVRETTLGAYAHQDLPFERLVEELGVERSLAHAPLVQVVFAVQNHERARLELAGMRLEPFPLRERPALFDLGLTLVEGGAGLRGVLTYRTDLWDAATAERLMDHFRALLEGVVADPGRTLPELDVLSPAERRQVVEEWNATAGPLPDAPVHALVSEQAGRTPDASALVCGGERLTYAELESRANRLAHFLRKRGIGPEARVGLLLERGPEALVALLGVLKAGGAYVPLDPDYPAERLAYILRDSGARVLLTRSGLVERLPAGGATTVCLDAEQEALAAGPAHAPPVELSPESLAYVIYTSGSTGTPKGVLVPHGGLGNLVAAARQSFGTGPRSRVLHAASLSFDASVLEIFLALTSGAALVVAERSTLLTAEEHARLLERERVDTWIGGPTLLDTLPPGEYPHLRTVVLGGERCGAETAARWAPGRRLFNAYAPTEATIYATLHRGGGPGAPPIGRPVRNLRAYVLDAHGRPVPVGVPGEIHLGGAGVVRGYHTRPGLTAERFAPDPFGGEPGARMYRTGDRGRWLASGELEFLGRVDHQVKVRGFRIEPGEIESVLDEHPGVRESVVVAREDAPGDTRLVAYVVAGSTAATPAALRSHLRERLPEYMVPGAFTFLEALPLTPTGKVDRRSLPKPEAVSGEEHVAPRTPTEEILAGIWSEVLGVERVGTHDDFFHLGGHSLLATRVASRVRALLGVELPLRALFEHPTVEGAAACVEALRHTDQPCAAPPLVPAASDRPLRLSFAQERLWVLDRIEPGSAAYNMPFTLRIAGRPEHAALRSALGALVRRHGSLRTVFPEEGGRPGQRILPPRSVPLPVADLSALAPEAREAEALRLRAEGAQRPFDLAGGPLFRAGLVRLAEDDHLLLLCMHHIVSDGWSMGILFRDLGALYEAALSGRPDALPEPAVQYADYALWQRDWLQGEALERQTAYWRERLAGAPALLELPTDRPRPPAQSFSGAALSFSLPPETVAELRGLARGEGVTLFMVLLAGLDVLLSRYAGEEDVMVGTPVAGRRDTALEELVGLFVNTLVLRTDLSGEPTFRELLARVRETTLGAYQHQDVPFEKLVEVLAPERSLAHTPLFQVLFTFQNTPREAPTLPGLALTPVPQRSPTAKFDLSFTLAERDGGVVGAVEYSTALFDASTIERMAGHLRILLEGLAAEPGRRIAEPELLSPEERRQVLEVWNATDAEYPSEACVHELFEQQAERSPDAVALVYEGERLSYAELNARANRLAHHLRERGVGPEVRVGICVERSLEMVVSLLAVLKAGGAYVPLDPDYPQERLAYMLQDSGVPVLLTQARLAERLPEHGAHLVCVDTEWERIATGPATPPESGVGPESLAYVIYTSGSTGRPKGAMNEHRGVVNRLLWMQEAYRLTPDDGVLQKTPFSFDVSVWEFFWPLLTGARLVLARPEGHRDPQYLSELIERAGVTTLHFVPPMLQAFLEAGEPARCGSLRRVVCSGEALPYELVERFFERLPGTELHNLYGPTEAAVDVTHWACEPRESRMVPIGRPVANTRIHVLDAALHPAPVGVPGELYIGGVQVGRGYLGRAELTAEKFVPDPFSAEPGARLYRTGDQARWLVEGEIEYLGRLDQQVKIRGFRIEPGEIESALLRHPGVREAVVLAREDAPGDRRLVAYWVGATADPVAVEALREHLLERLPEHMVPSAYVQLEALPLTPAGKVDRRALPAPELAATEEYVAPRTALEEVLANTWAEVLGVERVGVHDHFFELGGHSLLATQVSARLKALKLDVPVRLFFQTPTVEEMARELVAREASPGQTERLAALVLRLRSLSPEDRREMLRARQALPLP